MNNIFFSSFSAFDFKKHGNVNYGSPHNASPVERSSQGKMEKSFLRYVFFVIILAGYSEAIKVLTPIPVQNSEKLKGLDE